MIVTFGEVMLRLQPPGYLTTAQAKSFDATYGGAEGNVAVSLANFGKQARLVTGVPDNALGSACIGELRRWGVDTSCIIQRAGRLGIYFCEKGASQRPSKVLYDRADSVISTLGPADFDWDRIFDGASWFHFTGITPALSDSMAEAVLAACKAAKQKNITISCDLNYRKKLWNKQKAGQVMSGLMPYVDVLIANEDDAADVFGIHAPESNTTAGELHLDGYRYVAKELADRFSFAKVAITLRESVSASCNHWSALLYDGEQLYTSKKYTMQIVDRVGGGDSFCGGLIYSLTEGYSSQEALEFAVAASCLKHSVEGDFNTVSVEDVKALMGGDGSGRVQR